MAVSYDIASLVSHAHIVRFMRVATITILTYDWLLLLGDEVEFIWKSPSLFVKIFYLIIRYPTFADTSLTIIYLFTPRIQLWHCLADYVPASYIFAVGAACTELVLIWRTYALWNESRRVLVGLLAMWTMWACGNIYPVFKFARSLVFVVLPGVPGCFLVSGDPIIFTSYASLLAVEVVIIVLTLIKGIRTLRGSRSALVKTLYSDGILFFLLVACSSLGNVLTLLLAPIEYTDLLNGLARVLHTVVSCRVVIHLRRAARRDEGTEGTARPQGSSRLRSLPSVRFWHPSQRSGETAEGAAVAADPDPDLIEMSDMVGSDSTDPGQTRSVQEVLNIA